MISLGLCLGLSGCPMPIPTCREFTIVKPGIDLKRPAGTPGNLPDGYALVLGQFVLRGYGAEGPVSARLISYKDVFGREPYGEREVQLEPDGTFRWLLPPGDYAIQPLYLRQDYEGHTYRTVESIGVSLSFNVAEPNRIYVAGRAEVMLSPALEVLDLRIVNELPGGSHPLPELTPGSGDHGSILLRRNPDPNYILVPRRKICRKWNMPSWCVPVAYGKCFNMDEG